MLFYEQTTKKNIYKALEQRDTDDGRSQTKCRATEKSHTRTNNKVERDENKRIGFFQSIHTNVNEMERNMQQTNMCACA